MAQAHAAPDANKYFVPHDSHWPIVGSVALFTLMVGVVSFLNHLNLQTSSSTNIGLITTQLRSSLGT